MTYEEFRNEVLEKANNREHYMRLGQFVFNYIDAKYGVARVVQFKDGVDCFHRDDLIEDFIKCCYKRIYSNDRD